MTVKQISVFVENKPGKLAEVTKILYENGIDMRALSIAETPDFGIMKIIVNDSYKAACVLKEAGYVCSITPVLAVVISDEPGSLCKVLEILGENQISVEYTYAFLTRTKNMAYMIIRVEDARGAADLLTKKGIKVVCQDELFGL